MNLIYLTILFPLIGFVLLAFSQGKWSEKVSATIGCGTLFLSMVIVVLTAIDFSALEEGKNFYSVTVWHWMSVDTFNITFTAMVDGLSLTMLGVVTGVGFLVHLYSVWYMKGEEGFSRFFAYTNLFIASMLILVLSDNLLVMFLGWEGVGLCSYLLIGFYYKNSRNGIAAFKAFIITRIGDVFMLIAFFLIYSTFGTLNINDILSAAPNKLPVDSSITFWITLLLFGGAVGKSAQLPLQTWLADAMAGPTPVSALIHAATMVTAGVYLIARLHGLFVLSPTVLMIIIVIGVLTMLISGFSALVQTDIKRILAYSTMGQLGYMFIALGVQSWDAAIFHLMTHAFFKALLFLSAGSVIIACHHEQNIFKMGGLRKRLPLVYFAFLIGGGALAALPIVTAGFYSKESILWGVASHGYLTAAILGVAGSFITSLYIFRLIFVVFHGKAKTDATPVDGWTHNVPLIILMVLSTFVGALITPPVAGLFPQLEFGIEQGKLLFEVIASIIAILGVILAGYIYLDEHNSLADDIVETPIGKFLYSFWYKGWGFDWLYNQVFVKPYRFIAYLLKSDPINLLLDQLKYLSQYLGQISALSVNGYVRWYLTSMVLGAIVVLIFLVFV